MEIIVLTCNLKTCHHLVTSLDLWRGFQERNEGGRPVNGYESMRGKRADIIAAVCA